MSQSVIVLMESADRALDHEESPMQDWEFIGSYIISDKSMQVLEKMSSIPVIGKIFKSYLFDHFSLSYDIMINFIEGHDLATKMILSVIENQIFISKILTESKLNI